MGSLRRIMVTASVAVSAASTVATSVATLGAYRYRARTGEGFVFAYVLAGWAVTVLVVAATALLLVRWRARDRV